MIERRVARRYASALFSAASKADAVDRIESDLGLIGYTIESSPRLFELLRSPLLPNERKRAVVRDVFAGRLHEISLSYVDLLVMKRRIDALPLTESEYVLLANEARGIAVAHVTTAVPITGSEASALAAKLSKLTGKSVRMETSVDEAIIGGALVRIGDTVIDGSVKGRLEAIRERLLS